MIKVGITGGIGSGKTTVCKLFETLGVPVYYADDRAKEIIEEDKKLIIAIKKLFGKDIYDSKGKLKKKEVAQIVFSNTKILKQYNTIVHPAVIKDAEAWMKKHKKYPYAIKEAALLFEAGIYKDLDCVITVSAPQTLRIQRVMQRDNITRTEVMKRIKNQWSEKRRNEEAHIVFLNDGKHKLIPQVYAIHELFNALHEQKLL
ncbi:MAG: dephospho-CoA kinase [Fimbriimonadaceae bacterium]|nr:dephospho-CoA kinase [Chitinophagales bacterium]